MPTDGIITLNLEKFMTARGASIWSGTLLTRIKPYSPHLSLDALSRAKEAGFSTSLSLVAITLLFLLLSGAGAGNTCYLLQRHLFV